MRILEDYLQMSMWEFEMPVRCANCLDNNKINTVESVLNVSERDMLNWKNFGKLTLKDLKKSIARVGILLDKDLAEEVYIHPESVKSFEELMLDSQFKNAILTYWGDRTKQIPFMSFYKFFDKPQPDEAAIGYTKLYEYFNHPELSPDAVQTIAKCAVRQGVLEEPLKEPRKQSWDRKKCDEIYTMIMSGKNAREISEIVGMTRAGVSEYLKRRGLSRSYKSVRRSLNESPLLSH